MEVFREATLNFLPTPAKSHYTFSLRDFSRVIGGCLLLPAARLKEQEKLVRLWTHETYRVFNDRLVDQKDRLLWVSDLLKIKCTVKKSGLIFKDNSEILEGIVRLLTFRMYCFNINAMLIAHVFDTLFKLSWTAQISIWHDRYDSTFITLIHKLSRFKYVYFRH